MTFKTLTKALLAGVLFMGVTGAASAADSSAMAQWKEKASRVVGYNMEYPRISIHQLHKNAHNVVDLRIDHDGRILDTAFVQSSGMPQFDRASRNFAKRIDKLPKLPSSEYQNGAFVRVHLFYADTESDLKQMLKTKTQTTRIASMEIRNDRKLMAGTPMVELFLVSN